MSTGPSIPHGAAPPTLPTVGALPTRGPNLRPRSSAALAVSVLALAALTATPAHPAARYQPPVDAPIARPFTAPAGPFAEGHRGIDFRVQPGTAVRPATGGLVVFAGTVAREAWVSVSHPDGLTSSYGPLAEVAVAVGDRVTSDDVIGEVAVGHGPAGVSLLHLGVRRGNAYLDPATLFEDPRPWVPTLLPDQGWEVTDLPDVHRYEDWEAADGWSWFVPGAPRADGPGFAFAPTPNRVVGLAGLGSQTGRLPMDLTWLGYAAADVSYFSYSGLDRRPGLEADDPFREHGDYVDIDTYRGVDAAARLLREQLRSLWAREPGRAVDLVGHSMGGVVAMHYLLAYHDPADPSLPPIGNVATLASPLEGAAIASAIVRARGHPVVGAIIDAGLYVETGGTMRTQALEDLRIDSDLLAGLADAWSEAQEDRWTSPLATGTRVATFGGSRDLVVPEHRSNLPGADHAVLPGGHDRMRRSEAAYLAVHSFLAGEGLLGPRASLGTAASMHVSNQLDAAGWYTSHFLPGGIVPVTRTPGPVRR